MFNNDTLLPHQFIAINITFITLVLRRILKPFLSFLEEGQLIMFTLGLMYNGVKEDSF